ncbi:DinB family protein [Flavobacterium sp.]|uniref:DinB family protein n=1 Tax=Flavobacterium sp. TaxID=239 RepID=UPI0026359604|nr:DinB family protein [Flavobacterium sp.]
MSQNFLITTSLRNWEEQNKRLLNLVDYLSDEQLKSEIAPTKNTGIYLLGHLAAINYGMIVLFGLAENPQPQLDTIFLFNADKAITHNYKVSNLREVLTQSIKDLGEKLKLLTDLDWLDRHNNISVEEFKTQPHRNKINVLVNRTLHLSYHLGQLSLLKK